VRRRFTNWMCHANRARSRWFWVAHSSRVLAIASRGRELGLKDCCGETPQPALETSALPGNAAPSRIPFLNYELGIFGRISRAGLSCREESTLARFKDLLCLFCAVSMTNQKTEPDGGGAAGLGAYEVRLIHVFPTSVSATPSLIPLPQENTRSVAGEDE